jgi:hypothetical protein
MSGDEVDLPSSLEVEFLLEISTIFGPAFRSCVAHHLCLQFFLDHPQNICFLLLEIFFRGWSKSRDAKEKSRENSKIFTNAILD